jgi:predicted ATPase
MIKSIKISNFKSVVDLKLELGRFNVLIGENGCGKSNILESIAFGAAASADKLDYEFLGSRGIRLTNPDFMYPAFSKEENKKSIDLAFRDEDKSYDFNLYNDKNNPKKWNNRTKENLTKEISNLFNSLLFEKDEIKRKKVKDELDVEDSMLSRLMDILSEDSSGMGFNQFMTNLIPTIFEKAYSNPEISNYIVYSPEQSSLRKFEETTQIYPLGVKGEGLFQYLKDLAFDGNNITLFKEIKENLELLDWYEDFTLPENLMTNEYALNIKDRYLDTALQFFDQRSTNEGFLFLLFYSTLFISKDTPDFFAIDNIDTSFNPKLCKEIIRNLVSLSQTHGKQVMVTTHNPAILDGLNLKDDNQRLFVVRRNDDGYTTAKRIEYKSERKLKLSEIWTNGFIGGLPENF